MIERITVYYDGVVGPTNQGPSIAIGFIALFNDRPFAQESSFQENSQQKGMIQEEIKAAREEDKTADWDRELFPVTAKYLALIAALRFLLHKNRQKGHVRIYGDSAIIINEMNGVDDVSAGHAIWYSQARKLARKFADIGFTLLPREQTKIARELAEKEFATRNIEHADQRYARMKVAKA